MVGQRLSGGGAQPSLPDLIGQGAVAHVETVADQQFLEANHVAVGRTFNLASVHFGPSRGGPEHRTGSRQ
jgi:hypothetical protein